MSFYTTQKNDAIFCRLSLDNGSTWIQGIITSLSFPNNSMKIYLSSKNFYKYANFKNKLIIKALDLTHENIYVGTINQATLNNKSHFIKVNIESILSFYDKRKYIRFLVNYRADIQINNHDKFHVKLSDLSFGGLCFFSRRNLLKDSNVLILLHSDRTSIIHLYGNIVDKIPYEHEFRYSVSIVPKSLRDQEKLGIVMDSLLLKQNGIKSSYLSHLRFKTFLIILASTLLCTGCIWLIIYYLF